jgi:hypothetical protein
MSRREGLCPPRVVQADSQRRRALITVTYEECRRRAKSAYAPLAMRPYTWCRMNARHVGDGGPGQDGQLMAQSHSFKREMHPLA